MPSPLNRAIRRRVLYRIYRRFSAVPALYRPLRQQLARRRLKRWVGRVRARRQPCRIVVGAGKTRQPGWIPTEIYTLDLTSAADWARYFVAESVDAIVAEHVWEHLTPEQATTAARHCYRHLKPGAYLRVAVPDGLFPSDAYIRAVEPGGTGPAAWDHKVLYTYRTLPPVFETVGFTVTLLEYWDEEGTFHEESWDAAAVDIERSLRNPSRTVFARAEGPPLHYSSIILDAHK